MSNKTENVSLLRSCGLSRRISLATHSLSGASSQRRADTYTFSSSNVIHASVFSVAGSLSSGMVWRNPVIGGTSRYTDSSSRPSRRIGSVNRMARTVAFPRSSRLMTAGGTGGGGPSMRSSERAASWTSPCTCAAIARGARSARQVARPVPTVSFLMENLDRLVLLGRLGPCGATALEIRTPSRTGSKVKARLPGSARAGSRKPSSCAGLFLKTSKASALRA